MGYGLHIGYIDHLYTPLGTASNCSAIAELHSLQITTATTKPSPACCVLNSRSLATALTVEIIQFPALTSLLSGEYPASELGVNCQINYSIISSQPLLQNSSQLPTLN
jgi:hypothetical protein